MPKVIISQLSKSEVNKMLNLLHSKIARIKTKKEAGDFIDDFLTESEQIMLLICY